MSMELMTNKFIDWLKHDAKYLHVNVMYGVKNLIKWFQTIWKDRDWDHHYIYDILKHKLEFQANHIAKQDVHTRSQRDAEVMLLCVKLIEIQQEDLYSMEYLEYQESEINFDRPSINVISENYDEYLTRYPRQFKKLMDGKLTAFGCKTKQELYNDKQMASIIIAHENQTRSRKLLFKLLEQNIETWWH